MRANILIVCKPPVSQELKGVLDAEGHHIYEAQDVERALFTINRERPDLVYIDARNMPYEEILVKGRELYPDIEFVLVTSLAEQKMLMKKAQFEIFNFLIPPITPDQIRTVTNRALRQTKLTRENRRLHAAIAAAKAEWEATVDAIEDPIFIIDFDHNIKRANLALFKSLGKGVSEVIGRQCSQVLPDISEEQTNNICQQIKETGSPVSIEVDFKRFE